MKSCFALPLLFVFACAPRPNGASPTTPNTPELAAPAEAVPPVNAELETEIAPEETTPEVQPLNVATTEQQHALPAEELDPAHVYVRHSDRTPSDKLWPEAVLPLAELCRQLPLKFEDFVECWQTPTGDPNYHLLKIRSFFDISLYLVEALPAGLRVIGLLDRQDASAPSNEYADITLQRLWRPRNGLLLVETRMDGTFVDAEEGYQLSRVSIAAFVEPSLGQASLLVNFPVAGTLRSFVGSPPAEAPRVTREVNFAIRSDRLVLTLARRRSSWGPVLDPFAAEPTIPDRLPIHIPIASATTLPTWVREHGARLCRESSACGAGSCNENRCNVP